jgi:hypothetical protein
MSRMSAIGNDIIGRFEPAQHYLDSKVTQEHLYYLSNADAAR